MIKVQKISGEVDEVARDITTLSERARAMTAAEESEQLAPRDAAATLKKMEYDSRCCTEALVRHMLQLDAVEGGAAVRPLRREQVKRIQTMLDGMDGLCSEISAMHRQAKEHHAVVERGLAAESLRAAVEACVSLGPPIAGGEAGVTPLEDAISRAERAGVESNDDEG